MVRIEPNRMDCICCDADDESRAKNSPRPVAKASTVPVAISRCVARLPNAPMTSAPPSANTPMPSETGSPNSTAPVAPGSPIWASACAANVEWRAMVKYPITPAASEMHRAARKALVMNGADRVYIQSGSKEKLMPVIVPALSARGIRDGGIVRPRWCHACRERRHPPRRGWG